jgi:hypothetical protein
MRLEFRIRGPVIITARTPDAARIDDHALLMNSSASRMSVVFLHRPLVYHGLAGSVW